MTPPIARKTPHETRLHGVTLVDDYFWLRQKSDPEVIAHLEAENAYAEAVMQPLKQLEERLYEEMLGRIKQTDLSVPSRLGDFWYYSRTEEGKQYPYMCRRRGTMQGREEILLDLNALAEGHVFLGLGAYVVSDDGTKLAYSLDTSGYRVFTLQVKDLETGEMLPDSVERVGSVVWGNDNATVLFTTEDPVSKRSDHCWRRVVGSGAPNDLVFEEKDELYDLAVGRSLDRKVLFLGSYAKTSREIRYLDARTPAGEFSIVVPRREAHEYDVDHYEGQFYITTNRGAKNFKVVTAPMDDPSEQNWNTFIAHNPAVKIDGLSFFKRHLVVSERERGLSYLRVIDMSKKTSHRIATDEPDYAMAISINPEFDTKTIRYSYESMVTPPSVYRVRHGREGSNAPEAAGRTWRLRSRGLRGEARVGAGARRCPGAGVAGVSPGNEDGRQRADAALRLRFVRHFDGADILVRSTQPARSRRDLRHCLYPRRWRAWRGVARAGANAAEDEHVP